MYVGGFSVDGFLYVVLGVLEGLIVVGFPFSPGSWILLPASGG